MYSLAAAWAAMVSTTKRMPTPAFFASKTKTKLTFDYGADHAEQHTLQDNAVGK